MIIETNRKPFYNENYKKITIDQKSNILYKIAKIKTAILSIWRKFNNKINYY